MFGFWAISGDTQGLLPCAQILPLAVFRGPYGILGIKHESTTYEANTTFCTVTLALLFYLYL